MPDPSAAAQQPQQPTKSWAWVLTWIAILTAVLVAISLVMLWLG